jgi:pimeloyl-ACP methyl ester carboxylesterase
VVAPFMRGYAPTGPAPDGAYQTAALAQDAVALIDTLGGGEAAVIGHDWGAMAAYGAALFAPDKVTRLVTMAVPYGDGFRQTLATDYAQQKRSWYMFFFQLPLADAAFAHDGYAMVERLWRDWSPGYTPEPQAMAALKQTFGKPGVATAALDYYRCTFNPARQRPELAERQRQMLRTPIAVPTLYLHGADDGCIGPEVAGDMTKLFPAGLRRAVVAGAGHFLHLEQPQAVNRLIAAFLGRPVSPPRPAGAR